MNDEPQTTHSCPNCEWQEAARLDLVDQIEQLEARLKTIQEDERVLTCVYCGHEYPPGTPASNSEALDAHIRECPKHPLAQSLAREAAVRELKGDER